MNVAFCHDIISSQILNAFENQKPINKQKSNLIHVSEDTILLKISGNINISIKRDDDSREYKFFRTEEKHKVTEDKMFFKINTCDDPGIEFDVPMNIGKNVLESIDILNKYNKKSKISLKLK